MHLRTVMNLDEFLRISWYLRLLDAKIPQVLLKSFSFPCTCFVKMRQKIQTWQNTNCSMLYFLLVSLSASRAASSRGNPPKTWTVHHSFSKSWSLAIDFVFNKHHFDHKRLPSIRHPDNSCAVCFLLWWIIQLRAAFKMMFKMGHRCYHDIHDFINITKIFCAPVISTTGQKEDYKVSIKAVS